MNKLFKLYIILFIVTPIIIHTAPKQEKNESPQILMLVKSENKNLATIADNALFLVHQIQKNDRNETDRKRALKNIDITLKKLSNTTKNKLINDISLIKKESNAFASHRKPLQKYSSLAAEQALKNLTDTIKKIAENKSEIIFIEAQQKLLHAISQTETVEKETIIAINKAQEQLRMGVIDFIEAAKIIGEQHYLLNAAKRSLQKEISQALEQVKQSDIQTNYLSQFSTAVYNLASRTIAPFKAGYWSTEKEKEIAHNIIEELEQQLIQETYSYETALAYAKTDQERFALQQNYDAMIQRINNEIYQQKIITGEVMSTNRKLFWTAVLAAGALTAGILGYKYLTAAPTETALPPSATVSKQPSQQEQLVSEQIVEPTEILPNIIYEPITKPKVAPEIPKKAVEKFEEGIEKEQEKLEKEEEQTAQEALKQELLPEIPVTAEPTEIIKPEYTDILGPEKTTKETIERLSKQNEEAAEEQRKVNEEIEDRETRKNVIESEIEKLNKVTEDAQEQFNQLSSELEDQMGKLETDISTKTEEKQQLEEEIEDYAKKSEMLNEEEQRIRNKIEAIENTIDAEEELAEQEKLSQESEEVITSETIEEESASETPLEEQIQWGPAPELIFPGTERPQF